MHTRSSPRRRWDVHPARFPGPPVVALPPDSPDPLLTAWEGSTTGALSSGLCGAEGHRGDGLAG